MLSMEIDLEVPSGEHDKEGVEPNVIDIMVDGGDHLHGRDGDSGNMVDGGDSVHAGDGEIGNMVGDGGGEGGKMVDDGYNVHGGDGENGRMLDVGDELHNLDGRAVSSPTMDAVELEGGIDLEPYKGMEFESHEAAYSYYQVYAKSMGFTTTIKNSRRSKISREFIDAKFACSRYGSKQESDKAVNKRPSVKTNCLASMHVKRKPDGKWVIHNFVKEHNHELLPALAYYFQNQRNVNVAEKNSIDTLLAVSAETKRMYVAMSRQTSGNQNVVCGNDDMKIHLDKGRYLALEAGDAQVMLEHFMHMQNENSNFFYAMDLNEEQRLRNVFWVDAKSRHDYTNFSDVVSLDTTYFRNKYKLPFVPFIGVNHHFQFVLLGCALIADETTSTFVWLMRTWLRAMGGRAPNVVITDQDQAMKVAVAEVFPDSRHCFCLWHIVRRIPENLGHLNKRHENFMAKFNKCIHRSWTDEEFEKRWWKMVDRFELKGNEWVQSLYADRKQWVPTYMIDTFLSGMSTAQRSESVNSFFDKYLHRKTTLKELLEQYEAILQDRYEEEAKADFDTWHKQPALKSPSPFEKQMSTVYTHAIFKKFQVEVLGAVACHPKKEKEDETSITFRVQDFEEKQDYIVAWNASLSEVSCLCHLFEYKGFLCRHAMIVLQICGVSNIPSHYILNRWTKYARSDPTIGQRSEQLQSRVQRYNNLCQQAIRLAEEASLSQESYNIAFHALEETLKRCVTVNNSCKSIGEPSTSATHRISDIEEENRGNSMTKTNKRKNTNKKRKVHLEPEVITIGTQDGDSYEQLGHMNSRAAAFDASFNTQQSMQGTEQLCSRSVTLDAYYGTQQRVQGMVHLNSMTPTCDGYYVNQPNMQGLGQLNSIAPSHDGYYGTQQCTNGLGQLDFRPPISDGCYAIQGPQNP